MSKKEIIEKNVEIANRIPPGDRWQVIGVEGIQNGLTDALEAYYNVAWFSRRQIICYCK
jgi:hypothetical protein